MSGLHIEYRAVDTLTEYSENSKIHSEEQVAQVAASIEEFGFTNPLLVDADGILIAGHGRLLAAKKLGMDQVPVIELDHLTDAQRRAYVIADNKLAENSSWDEAALAREIAALQDADYNLDVLGFDDKDLAAVLVDEVLVGLTDQDNVPEVPDDNQAVSQSGDLWLLGGHRLLCGDSTSVDDVSRLMDGELADLVWTDPPYNVDYKGKCGVGKTIKNDSMDDSHFYNFLLNAFSAAHANTRAGGGIYIAHAHTEARNFQGAMVDSGFLLKQCLVWVKNAMVMGRQDYQWKHEPILYGWKSGAAHSWYGEFNKTTVIDNETDPQYMSQIELVAAVNMYREHIADTVIRVDKPTRSVDHPTMKPVDLVVKMIKNSSKLGGIVLDLFGGSGTTLIAAEKTRRRSRLIELDPVYCDVIVLRWQEFTGQDAALSDGRLFSDVKKLQLNNG